MIKYPISKVGFTLVELQISLILTLLILSGLFAFTRYYYINHFHLRDRLAFQRQSLILFDWAEHQWRNATGFEVDEHSIRFHLFNGGENLLRWDEKGPSYQGARFYTEPVLFKLNAHHSQNSRSLMIEVTQSGLTQRFERDGSIPVNLIIPGLSPLGTNP